MKVKLKERLGKERKVKSINRKAKGYAAGRMERKNSRRTVGEKGAAERDYGGRFHLVNLVLIIEI